MAGEKIMFFENDDESHTLVDLYLNNNRVVKFPTIIMILMPLMYYCLKKVTMNMLLNIMT